MKKKKAKKIIKKLETEIKLLKFQRLMEGIKSSGSFFKIMKIDDAGTTVAFKIGTLGDSLDKAGVLTNEPKPDEAIKKVFDLKENKRAFVQAMCDYANSVEGKSNDKE